MSADSDLADRLTAGIMDMLRPMQARIEALEKSNRALAETLRFYADPEVYRPHPHGPGFDNRDLSFNARAALASIPEQEK